MQACLAVCFEYYPRWPMNIKCNCVQVLYSHQCFCYKALCRKKLGHVAIKETFFCPQTIPAEWFWNVSRSWLYCTSNERVDLGLHTALIQATKTIYIYISCTAYSPGCGGKGSLLQIAKSVPLQSNSWPCEWEGMALILLYLNQHKKESYAPFLIYVIFKLASPKLTDSTIVPNLQHWKGWKMCMKITTSVSDEVQLLRYMLQPW